MDKETIEALTDAIKALTFSTNVQCELMESLQAKQSDLITEIKTLRNAIEKSSPKG
ncbi:MULTISPECIES: hypothetical protein [unclassified Roseovarius]|uniref:hypothetical protein n=1 Tax=unclassified Roseovarius TaxID=2614913 RepID=UPI00273FA57E|nr:MULTISPECIES: hypothetical protein [unclassified Roseovarius]